MRELVKRQIDLTVLRMSCYKPDTVGKVPVRERNACISCTTGGCRYTGNNLEGNFVLNETGNFLPSPAKNERITSF